MRAAVLVPLRTQQRALSAGRPTSGNGSAKVAHATEDRLAEAAGLARAIGLDVVAEEIVPLPHPRPATLFGSGKVAGLGLLFGERQVTLAIVDHALSPVQQRNLEKAWGCKVLDRTGLILEIFGQRARTREGRLQVELAHLTYQKSRLVRTWTHLERQRGGFGFMGGPGEAQIETDRRLIDERVAAIRKELTVVVKTRTLHRAARSRVPLPVVALVGYTNAGKSTLFNRVTGAEVSAKDQVFETLDPTMRELRLPGGRKAILSDTVGFISDLPTELVAAFRATLEEVVGADLVLHVRDISHPGTEAQRHDVERVLTALGIDAEAEDGRVLEVGNKADRLSAAERADAERSILRHGRRAVLVAARTGEGVEALLEAVDRRLGARDEVLSLEIPAGHGRVLSWLHAHAEVLEEAAGETGAITARVRIAPENRGKLAGQLKRAGLG